jgi:hypothetical protein
MDAALVNIGASTVMVSQKVVTPVKTGVTTFCNYLKTQDSGIRRNDEMV